MLGAVQVEFVGLHAEYHGMAGREIGVPGVTVPAPAAERFLRPRAADLVVQSASILQKR